MPSYAMICADPACSHHFEAFAHATTEAIAALECPKCGKRDCTQDWAAKRIGVNLTVGRSQAPQSGMSLRFGFDPDEVHDARRELPNWKISDDGDVFVEGGKHNARMMKDLDAMRAREAINRKQAGIEGFDSKPDPVTVAARKKERREKRIKRLTNLLRQKQSARKGQGR